MDISIQKISKGENIKESVDDLISDIGGIEKFIKKGERVLIKPNVNTADDPPASSDLDFVRAVVEISLEAGASEVIVGGSSTFYQNTRKNFEKIGLFSLEDIGPQVKVVSFDEGSWVKKKIDGKYLKYISTPEILEEIDKLIFLPCLKTHFITKITGSLKLGIGLMKPSERLALHARNTEEKSAESNLAFKPDLIILDGRKAFISGGPSKGELREPGILIASTSRLKTDMEAAKIIKEFPGNSLENFQIKEIPIIKRSLEIGIE